MPILKNISQPLLLKQLVTTIPDFSQHILTQVTWHVHLKYMTFMYFPHFTDHFVEQYNLVIKPIKQLEREKFREDHFVCKQSFTNVFQNRCSQNFCEFHKKASVLESLFNKVTNLLKGDSNTGVFL